MCMLHPLPAAPLPPATHPTQPTHYTRYGQTKYFYVMDYLFSPRHGCPAIHERFDLKGSWVDRHSAPGTQPLKDSDWAATRHLNISDEAKLELLAQVRTLTMLTTLALLTALPAPTLEYRLHLL